MTPAISRDEPVVAEPPSTPERGALTPGPLLRLEGLVILVAAVVAFAQTDASWWLFGGLLLVPDIGLAGYLAGPRVGAATYNLTHALVGPLTLGVTGLAIGSDTTIAVALIWSAHVGMDRAVGYGLKYRTALRDTHLQRVS